MNLEYPKEWFERSAEIEGNSDVGVGCSAATCSSPRVLRLTLKRKWFDMIASGEKKHEYREPKPWIMSRIKGKTYDAVEFSNGYGATVPKMLVRYHGYHIGKGKAEWGAEAGKEYAVLRLGDILATNGGGAAALREDETEAKD